MKKKAIPIDANNSEDKSIYRQAGEAIGSLGAHIVHAKDNVVNLVSEEVVAVQEVAKKISRKVKKVTSRAPVKKAVKKVARKVKKAAKKAAAKKSVKKIAKSAKKTIKKAVLRKKLKKAIKTVVKKVPAKKKKK
jgi:hypothetical protein